MSNVLTYPAYKKTDIPWVGDIPEHWELVPCRSIVENIVEKNHDGEVQNYLSLMANVGVIRYEDKGDIGNKKPDDLTKCKIVRKGQLVINSMNYAIGSYGMSPYDGVCSPVYIILQAKKNVLLERYGLRVFENSPFQKHLATFGNGILAHRAAIGWDDIKGQYIPLAPINEQEKILQYLDYETTKIDNLINKQQQLIKLLVEKRQAVINHAVTKGLNFKAPMKDSGVEWLGKVPEHWEELSIRRVLHKIEQGSSPLAQNRAPQLGEFGVLKISSVKKGNFYAHESKTLDSITQYDARYKVTNGDLLVTRANTPSLVADTCVVNKEPKSPTMMCDLIYRLVTTSRIDNHFLCMWLLSDFGRMQVESDARGSSMTMAKVSQEHIKAWITILPPLSEQRDIVAYLENADKKFRYLTDRAEQAIELMQERRTVLISAAVTGKIDVRSWKKPEVSEEDVA
ncbi:hypothetical protein N474_11390 [Pseudoalteromonas luteoviolacea CPMOR-2]|uniref:restriction endonuclease subunit S n=1 Tax=Pseudoalteromonas luteoviolacea TaxID=43657 RepID=UPI0007B089C2|nr:restriction endonuclease subunit S [Pseudoalteromonas luteoviolacea]KZN56341.1 hypothetical protein N474_11390 [Pseudoalteromonas luteoviolacea CPMOR-2]